MGKDSVQVARLAEELAKAGGRLLQALKVENKLKRKRGDVGRNEVRAVQRAVDECTEDYLKAVRQYVQFFQSATEEED